MIRKTTFYKRKLKGSLYTFFLFFLIFFGTFSLCFGIWWLIKIHTHFQNPLAKNAPGQKLITISKIDNLCISGHLNCSAININSDKTLSFMINGNERVIFSMQKDLTTQFSSLQLTIGHLTIDDKRFSRMDFRFDKPIIQY